MKKAADDYHHGNLRAALLVAGEAVLAESGLEGFSLRNVAKRVGVSHAAPAHHFGDARGLLTALAAEGFRRFLATMEARRRSAEGDATARIVASGLGYVDFAESSPALFRLMFSSTRPDFSSPELAAAADAAFAHLADGVAALRGVSPDDDPAAMQDVLAAWSMAHGIAELWISGRLKPLRTMSAAAREEFVSGMLRRSLVRPVQGVSVEGKRP